MLSLVGTTHWILNHGRGILLATAALLLLDACALRRDRALDRQATAHQSTEEAYRDARSGLLGSDAYLLAERAGTTLGQSEHVRFLEDQTVFKGTARYDGHPSIAEAFGVMSITTDAPATSVVFPQDTANAGG